MPASAARVAEPEAKAVRVAAVESGGQKPAVKFDGDWPSLSRNLNVGGVTRQLVQQSELRSFDGVVMDLAIPPSAKHLVVKGYTDKLAAALAEHFGVPIRVNIQVGEMGGKSAQEQAVSSINQDAFVHELLEQLDGTIVDSSIQPVSTQPLTQPLIQPKAQRS